MITCKHCGSKSLKKHGRYKIKPSSDVLRYKCLKCSKTFRSEIADRRCERRGRKPCFMKTSRASLSSKQELIIDIINLNRELRKQTFYKAAEDLFGKRRQTIRRYLKPGAKSFSFEELAKGIGKIREFLEAKGKKSGKYLSRLQKLANRLVEISVGPPIIFLRKDTIIWNKKSPIYKELVIESQ